MTFDAMKTIRRILFACIALALTVPAQAQDALEGTVHYDKTRTMKIELPPEMAHMQDKIPSESTTQRTLRFTERAALTRAAEPDEPGGIDAAEGNMNVQIRFIGRSSGDEATFIDLETGESVEKTEFLGRTFLITGDEKAIPWKLTGEQSEFLGYLCQKAVATVDSTSYEAWFTPQIPVAAGPDGFGGLPGLILVLSRDEGMLSYAATEVDLAPLAPDALARPEGGHAVTREEYRALVKERMAEMQAESGLSGSGGSFRIIRRGN